MRLGTSPDIKLDGSPHMVSDAKPGKYHRPRPPTGGDPTKTLELVGKYFNLVVGPTLLVSTFNSEKIFGFGPIVFENFLDDSRREVCEADLSGAVLGVLVVTEGAVFDPIGPCGTRRTILRGCVLTIPSFCKFPGGGGIIAVVFKQGVNCEGGIGLLGLERVGVRGK